MNIPIPIRALRIGGALAAAALALSAATAWSQADTETVAAEATRATALAREGRYDEALDIFRALRTAVPTDARLLEDETVVLGWAERDDAVLVNAASLDESTAPAYVLAAVGKAARNLRRFDDAARWYRLALERSPDYTEAALGLALTEADRGDTAAAQRALAQLPAASSDSPATLSAAAYLAQNSGQPLEALRLYERVLERWPTDRGAARGKALALRALLLPSEALAFASAHEGILTVAEIERLKADEAAVQLRLVLSTPYPPGERDEHYSQSLSALAESLGDLTDPAARAAVHSDRVIALEQAHRSREAIAEFEQLLTLTSSPPFEALAAAGRAHLDVGEADRAVDLLLAATALRPNQVEVRFALVFAYLDAERAPEALRLATALTREIPPRITGPGGFVTKPNPLAVRAELVAAVSEAYADQLADAQRRLETLLQAAPHNADARQELANVYRWRGWLDRSQSQYRQVLAIEPDGIAARAGYAHARLDAAAFDEVARVVDELQALDATDPAVRRLSQRWEMERRSELDLDVSDGRSTGTTFGSDQQSASVTWLSQRLGQWRAVASAEDTSADFPEGEGGLRRLGGGAEYRDELWRARAVALRETDDGDVGLALVGERRIGDHWRLSTSLDLDSSETPLRGRRVGLETDVLGAMAELRPDENRAIAFGWRHREHSDGNHGDTWLTQGWLRVQNAPRFKLDVTGEIATASNETDQVPYFSPRHDLFALVGLRHTARLFRHGEHNVTQVVDLGSGVYDQAGFESGRIWRLGYRLRLHWTDSLRAELGAERSRMFYDGAAEYRTTVMFGLTARL